MWSLVWCPVNSCDNLLVFFAVGCVALPRVVPATRAGLKPGRLARVLQFRICNQLKTRDKTALLKNLLFHTRRNQHKDNTALAKPKAQTGIDPAPVAPNRMQYSTRGGCRSCLSRLHPARAYPRSQGSNTSGAPTVPPSTPLQRNLNQRLRGTSPRRTTLISMLPPTALVPTLGPVVA